MSPHLLKNLPTPLQKKIGKRSIAIGGGKQEIVYNQIQSPGAHLPLYTPTPCAPLDIFIQFLGYWVHLVSCCTSSSRPLPSMYP